MFAAVLWDNDGILVDSERRFFELSRLAFAQFGAVLSEETWRNSYLGKGVGSRRIALSLGVAPARIDPVLKERNRRYLQILQEPPPVRPLVSDTLQMLHERMRLALVTGCHRHQLDLMHRTSGLLDYFECIVTGDDCARPKPDPELYRIALDRLGLQADQCLAVEDSERGLRAALAAGIACVVIPTDLTAGQNFDGALSIEKDASGILNHIDLSERQSIPITKHRREK